MTKLRRAGVAVDMAYRGNLKRRLSKADAQNAYMAIIVGENEIAKQEYTVKLLRSGGQLAVPEGRFALVQNMVREAAWRRDKAASIEMILTDVLKIGEAE